MPNEHISLHDIYKNPVAGGSIFRAQGFIDLTEKPTTCAMRQFKANRIALVEQDDAADEIQEASEAPEFNEGPTA